MLRLCQQKLSRVLTKYCSSKRNVIRSRVSHFEQLEARRVMAAAVWNNVLNPVNVNGDAAGLVSPLDVLLVVNELNLPLYSDPDTGGLPRQVVQPIQGQYLDVNCDGAVSPVDALQVINFLNGGGQNSTHSGGKYASLSCSPQLLEQSEFVAEFSQTVRIPTDSTSARVYFDAPKFDFSSKQAIRDAFEIEVTDLAGNPMAFPYLPNRDALYNWSEDLGPVMGAGVQTTTEPGGQDSSATLNLSGLAPGTEVRIAARLINNDADDRTSVILRGIELVQAPSPLPAGIAGATSRQASVEPVDLSELEDLTGSFAPSYGRTTLAGDNTDLVTELMVTNLSDQTVTGRILIAIDNFSALDAYAMHPDGILSDGRPYFDLSAEMVGNVLQPGGSLRSRELRFLNNSGQRFTYKLSTYGSLNAAPSGFDSTPIDTIEAGKTFSYTASANDPDGQPLVYSIVVGPVDLVIDALTGQLSWPTSAADIGAQSITLRATDPHGLYAEQSFTLEVVASLQNRPPNFVSDPVTDAIASSGFEITTVATGVGPAGVSVISGFRGPRLVSINAGDQSVSVHAGQNNDRFDDTTVYSTGEPKPTGAVIDVGYTVDVGLPPFLVPNDQNEVIGMDQGDFNSDGILDLVVMTARFESTQAAGQRNKIEIIRMLGDGDGNFGAPAVIASIPTTSFTNSHDQAKNLRIADIDGDGRLDVTALQESTPRLVTVRGLGDGSFVPVVFTTLDTPLNDYRLVDLDQDGNLDIVGRITSFVDLGWMRGAGNGTFAPFVRLAVGGGSWGLTSLDDSRPYDFADIDGDGDIDLINSQGNGGNVVIWLNDGAENFTVGATIDPPGSGNRGAYVLHVADFTGDGRLDIFTINLNPSVERVELFVRSSTGLSFTPQLSADVYDLAGNLAGSDGPVDIDGDGDLDIILANNISGPVFTAPQVLVHDGTGSFKRTDYPMADFPGHILASSTTNRDIARGAMFGDYNRDGVIDFSYMTSNASNGSDFNGVGIRLGTRPGEFGATRTVSGIAFSDGANQDEEVHAEDFNGDGKVDLLSLRNARMSLGNGDGTFQPSFPATSISAGFDNGVVADFNLDGIPDYVAARAAGSSDTRKFYVALGNGDGTFQSSLGAISPNQFYQYTDIRTADFNNDGYPDLIARAAIERFTDVYLNDPANPGVFSQSFRAVTTVQGVNALGYRHTITTGDFDSDGLIDFVTVDQVAGQPQKLQTFSGDGTGHFTITDESFAFDDAMFAEFNFYYPEVLQSGDVNGDGNLDVVSFGRVGFIVHIGAGNGSFTSVDHYPIETINQLDKSGDLIDFNQDGHLDLVQHAPQETLSIRLGKGDGTFSEPQRVGTHGVGGVLTFADFDNDGHLDMATVMHEAGSGAYVNDDVVFFFGTRNGLVDQLAVDLDGDGNEEVLAINDANDRLKIFAGDNLDRLNRQNDLLTGRAPQAVATGDLNGDSQLEIITANRAGRSISVFSGSLASGYTSSEILVGSAPIDVLTRDINGDGHVDVLVLDDVANAVWVLSGSASGVLSAPVSIALGDKPGKFTVADATGDGQLDAVITLLESNRLMILPRIGVQPVSPPIYVSVSDSPSDVQVTDLNADGNPDLATTLPGSNVLSVLYGRGNNQFARAQNIAVGDKPTRVTLADADEDGRSDLIVANSGDNTVSVIYNRFDPNEVYRYDSDAIDPDNDTLTYSIVDGPGGLIINSQTGALLWAASPDQVGEHNVTIAANDGRGGIATQSFKIDVQPARDNALPLIATEPNTRIGAGETFTYQATALDNDRDTLRYSLINAPAGAVIDPTNGKVTWDARADMALSFAPHGNGSSGYIDIEAHPSLQPTSLTVEGWYDFTGLPASNGRSNIISSGPATTTGTSYILYNSGNTSLRLEVDYPSPTATFTYTIPYVPTANRWTHFAITIDDSTRAAKIFVDGVERGSTTLPAPLVYNPIQNYRVGDSSVFFTRAIIDNYRLWNVVRTPAEIVEGLSRQYDGDTRLVLDYRFDEPQTLTVRDFSPAGNHGYRTANGLLPVFVPGLAETGSHQFTIGVDDGRGGFDQQSFTLDILAELRGTIRGQSFSDLNGNGSRDASSEPVMPGVHLFIDANGNGYPDPAESQTTTDTSGSYQFDGLLPGQYPVMVSPIAGFETPSLDPVSVTVNQASQVDLAIEQLMLSQIRGQLRTEQADPIAYWKVFADLDLDNERDENEPMAMSDRDGNFAITGLSAGNYTIRAELPAGWTVAGGANGQNVTLAADAISEGNHFTLEPTNTSVTGGLHFVTMPSLALEARQTFRYASVAMGIQDEPITYDLSLAPDGMSIDPATGLMAWRPTIAQVGEHLVIVRATNASGSIALHDFTLTVTAPNTAPTLSEPKGDGPGFPQAYVGIVYAVNLSAQDAESQSITYRLISGPSTAAVNSTTGELRWTPTLADVGNAIFSIELRDSLGATSIMNATVGVINSQPLATPFAVTLPRTQVGLGQNYFARIQGVDALDRPLAWSLVTGPTGLLVSPDGTIRWNPGNDDLGSHSIVLQATNVDGTSANSSFTLEVVGRPVNTAPSVTSEPATSTTLGKQYQYDVELRDIDADPLSFALVNAPVGMSIHPSLGTIRWTPAADQLGESDVSIQVTDPDGASGTQEFKLKVSKSGGPPAITSVPPTEASVGTGYLYSIAARDAEGDPLSFRLLAAPAGMTIADTTGVISWTPQAVQVGQQDVVIEVSDGVGGAVTQAFAIRVSVGAPNRPPVINSTAPRFGAVGMAYSYEIQATDPESTAIVYSLGQAPVGMTINASSGAVAWTPTTGQVGKSIVTLIATDAGGASAVESFELDVLAANSQPTIISTAPVESPAGAVFSYQVLGRDADLDQLTYELTTAPAGATSDSFGKITWPTTPALIGAHNFAVRVRDPRGGVATQSFTLSVIEDTVPPKVSLIESLGDANRNILPWQGPFIVYARAIDNVAIRSLTLQANGQDIPLDAAGTATFTFEDWRFQSINATATAVDTNGNITTKTIQFDYDFPEGWSGAGTADIPTVAITSPTDTAAVFGMVTITGTASHADFAGYKLSYRRIDETTFTEFHESTTAVVNGALGVWDTSLLINDEYVIRLEAASNAGVVNVVEHNVGLSGELKLGNFRLSFTDMVIPVAGIPIEITRIYDTLQADREGDFGYGWRLEYRNTDLRVGLPKSGLEDIGIYSPLRPGVKVYLNVPGVGRQGFTFNPEIRTLPGFGSNNNLALARPRFTPDRGVTSTLSTGTSNYLIVNEQGELFAPGGIPYNPASPDFGGAYVLTTLDGIVYRINGATGELSFATNNDGDRVSFNEAGIHSETDGKIVRIERDGNDRITRLVDPNGAAIGYSYSDGNLNSITDRNGNRSEFRYDVTTGFLNDVIDPLGRSGVRTEYDENGRLLAIVNSKGQRTEFEHDLNGQFQSITDAKGNISTFFFDEVGNITTEVDALGATTRREFNASGEATLVVNGNGEATRFEYDQRGRVLRVIDALGHTGRTVYAASGIPSEQVDSLGRLTHTQTVAANTLRVENNGGVFEIQVDGRTSRTTDSTGLTTFVESDASGNPVVLTDSEGRNVERVYDGLGRVTSETRVLNGQRLTTRFAYDSNGNVTSIVDAVGATKRFTYDQFSRLTSQTNSNGARTDWEYDEFGNLILERLPAPNASSPSPTNRYTYDQLGNRTSSTDPLGRITVYEYDAVNRLIATVYPDDTPQMDDNPVERIEYDSVGQVTARIDPRGARTAYQYDAIGRVESIVDPIGRKSSFEYDAVGRITKSADPMGRVERIKYDDETSRELVTDNAGNLSSVRLNPIGQVVEEVDELGRTTVFAYAGSGYLELVVDPMGNATGYEYDPFGNLVAQSDANGNRTSYLYDAVGRLVEKRRPMGQTEKFKYDAVGNLVSHTFADSKEIHYEHDDLGRVIREVRPEQTILTEYTETGQVASITDLRGRTVYRYDQRDRLVELSNPDGSFVRYKYDLSGNQTGITTPAGMRRYEYDLAGQLVQLEDTSLASTEFTYFADGQLKETRFPNGLIESRSYNELGFLKEIKTTRSLDGQVVTSVAYEIDAVGRRTSLRSQDGRTVLYEYDASDRLIRELNTTGGQISERSFMYDAAFNRVESLIDGLRTTYEYDSNDQLLREFDHDSSIEYSYDQRGQLTSKRTLVNGVQTNVEVYTWNSVGSQTAIDLHGDSTFDIEFDYDSAGNRVGERLAGQNQIRFLVDPTQVLTQVLEEYVPHGANSTAFTIVPNAAGPLSQVRSGQGYYYHQDGIGSVIAVSDANGTIVNSYAYTAYGEIVAAVEAVPNRQSFAGGRSQVDGSFHLRARVYLPMSGRFASQDPLAGFLAEPLTLHRYIYAGADPVNRWDPSGEDPTLAGTLKAISIQVAIAGAFTLVTGGGLKEFAINLALGAALGGVVKGLTLIVRTPSAAAIATTQATNQAIANSGRELLQSFLVRTLERVTPYADDLERVIAKGKPAFDELLSRSGSLKKVFETTQNIAFYIPAKEWARVPKIIGELNFGGAFSKQGLGFASDVLTYLSWVRPF